MTAGLYWLPRNPRWLDRLADLERGAGDWAALTALAGFDLDAIRTDRLDRVRPARFPAPPPGLAAAPERVVVLGSGTLDHLMPALRVAGLRRGLWIDTLADGYADARLQLADPSPALRDFRPTAVLLCFDARALTAGAEPIIDRLRTLWRLARDRFACTVLQQTLLPVAPALAGSNEHRIAQSAAARIFEANAQLRDAADQDGVDLVAIDAAAARHGIDRWHNPILWHHARQEISPAAAPLFGDLVVRVLAARRGLSRKVLVLDLDNVLWGGEVGELGLEGVALGGGSAEGEAFAAMQAYAAASARRGIVLAVCSKNDPDTARACFARHPEMRLGLADVACFVASWDDKATSLKRIADRLRLPLDSFVFVDDSPFERDLIRRALPMVAVPELPDDAALMPQCLADAGYFEAVRLTAEDRNRAAFYAADRQRAAAREDATDIEAYLASLEMRLVWRRFDAGNLARIHQLTAKTNQFNLTTIRYSEDALRAVMADPRAFGLQFRLHDRFGDSGIIGVVIGRLQPLGDVTIESWLMSCRVIGRRLEPAMLRVVAEHATRIGGRRLTGEYRPTTRNGIVAEFYPGLGFEMLPDDGAGRRFGLVIDPASMADGPVAIERGQDA